MLVVPGNFQIERIGLLGWVLDLGPLAAPITVVWLLACDPAGERERL